MTSPSGHRVILPQFTVQLLETYYFFLVLSTSLCL